MKQIIRYKVFETNSSSEHTLIITKQPMSYNIDDASLGYEGQKSFDLFNGSDNGSFERFPFQVLYSPEDKLRYWVARKIGTENNLDLIPEIIDLISKHTGLNKNKIKIYIDDTWDNSKNYGYCSLNDSGESPWEYLDKYNITVEDFVFNPKYIIIIDGDEYQELEKLFKFGIINLNNIEYISTGKDYWDPNVISIPYSWILRDEAYESFSNINQNTSKLIIDFTYTSNEFNHDVIKNFVDIIKALSFNIIIQASISKEYIKKLTSEDLKLFDLVNKI